MVFETESMELCHELTEVGRERWLEILEKAGDEILWRHENPVKWLKELWGMWLKGEWTYGLLLG